jgi:hypothetical protein
VREPAPDGAKSFGGFDIGAILVAISSNRILLRNLAGILSDFLGRPNSARTVTLTIGVNTYQAKGVSRTDQRRALEEFLMRCVDQNAE